MKCSLYFIRGKLLVLWRYRLDRCTKAFLNARLFLLDVAAVGLILDLCESHNNSLFLQLKGKKFGSFAANAKGLR
jgi:hypothetical protein